MTERESLIAVTFASLRLRLARWLCPPGWSVCIVGKHLRKGDATVALHD